MNTDLRALIESSMPSFAYERLERFSEFELRSEVAERRYQRNGAVDLSLVVGTEHPDYHGSSWLELIGNPPGHPVGRLKRIRSSLFEMASTPEYYLSSNEKDNWSFYLVDGRYHVSTGMHRTVIGRFLLACNDRPTVISGVEITELVFRKPVSTEVPTKEGFLRRLLRPMVHNRSVECTSREKPREARSLSTVTDKFRRPVV
jgi:hypothetical protein